MFNLDTNKRIVILSAEQADKSESVNAHATDNLRHALSGWLYAGNIDSVLTCDGQYKGAPERSFLIICDADQVNYVAKLANVFNQECVLVVRTLPATGRTVGSLHFPNGCRQRIGTLALCDQGRDYEASTTIHGTGITFCFE